MNPKSLPPVIRSAWVNRPPAEAFDVFTAEIGAWWPLPSHGIFGARSASVGFRDDKLIEIATDGSEAIWGEVVVWESGTRVVVSWHPGRDRSEGSEVEVSFEPDGEGTRVVLEHRGWERFGAEGMAKRQSYAGANAWGYVLDFYGDIVEPHVDAPELAALAAAYEYFFAEADAGEFGPARKGEWDADQVVAHVALNDAAMLSVCQAIVHGNPALFENELCQRVDVMQRWIDDAPGRAELIESGRHMARLVVASLSRLSADQLKTEVPCRLVHEGRVAADQAVPWGDLAITTQAETHLVAHCIQLRDLRDESGLVDDAGPTR